MCQCFLYFIQSIKINSWKCTVMDSPANLIKKSQQDKSQSECFQSQHPSQLYDPVMSYQMSGIRNNNIRNERAKGLSFKGRSSQLRGLQASKKPSSLIRSFRPRKNKETSAIKVQKSNLMKSPKNKKTHFGYSSMDLQSSTNIFRRGHKLQKSTNLQHHQKDNLFEYGMESRINRIKETHKVLKRKYHRSLAALNFKEREIEHSTQQLKNQLKIYEGILERLIRSEYAQIDKNSRHESFGSQETQTEQNPSVVYGLVNQI